MSELDRQPAFPDPACWLAPGLSKREYAAIELKVPASGNAELDAMIRTSMRNDLAKTALASIDRGIPIVTSAVHAYCIADVMLAEMEKK